MVEINRNNQILTYPQSNRAEQQALAKSLNTAIPERAQPPNQEKISLNIDKGISTELSRYIDGYALENSLKMDEEMAKIQSSLNTSLEEFRAFKEVQMAQNPGLDLSQLDLSLDKEGNLKLIDSNLPDFKLSELEEEIARNDKLVDAFSQVHTSTVEAIKLKSTSFEDLQPDHFNGSFMLNELTERYSNQFPPETYAIGRDYNTMEKRLNDTDPITFGGFYLDSLSIDFRA